MLDITVYYHNNIPDKYAFFELYKTTGWKSIIELGEDKLYEGINNSWYILSAYNENELIGFGRIISDGVFQAFICDLIVKPRYQNQGLGGTMLKKLLQKSLEENIISVQLCCAKGKSAFYKKFGFVERSEDAPGMWWRDRNLF